MAQKPATLKTVTLCTWNTQGNFTTDAKGQDMSGLLNGSDPALVLVQEGGVGLEGTYQGYTAVSGVAVGAFNERCTNYILYNKQWPVSVESKMIVNGSNMALVGGGVAGRTPAAVEIGKSLFVSWHSISAPNNLDTSDLLSTLMKTPFYADLYDLIVIGGDSNATPHDVGWIIAGIASGRGEIHFSAEIVHCGANTLKKWDKEVDFFVFLRKVHQQESPAVRVDVQTSDHYAVRTQLPMML